MHRLPALRAQGSGSSSGSRAESPVSAGRFSADPQRPWSLFVPLHYEQNYSYPLLVWLPGPRGDERQLKRLMPHISLRNYAGLALRGTEIGAEAPGTASFSWDLSPEGVERAIDRLDLALDTARRELNLAPRRVFLAGFDRGGTMAWRMALRHPDRFAGVLSLGGRFPQGHAPLCSLPHSRRVPIFLACGQQSAEYPAEQTCHDLRLLHAAGMSVDLRLYPCGHEIAQQMLADMNRWMMAIVTGQGRPSASSAAQES